MVDFENEGKMITADIKSVSEALKLLKKINRQEKEIFEYIKAVIKEHASEGANETTESELKEFFEYISWREIDEISLPHFNV